jgi:acetyl esterase/lipase
MAVSAAAALTTCVSASGSEPTIRRDVSYAGTTDPQQTLDLYVPATGKDHPIVVWIHGGGWAYGDKTDTIGPKYEACTEKGFVFASIGYRLLFVPKEHPGSTRPAVGIPDIESDIAKAIRWLHENAGSFDGNPNFIVVMGHSAGAQLAALLCTDESYLRAEGLTFALIKGCVPVDGDTYYPALQIDTGTPQEVSGKRHSFPDERAERELSSVLHVAAGKGIPPFLLMHVADFPETRTWLQSEVLGESLRSAGVPERVFAAKGKTHLTIDADLGLPGEPITRAMLEFIDEQVWRTNYSGWTGALKAAAADGSTAAKK